MGGGRAVARCGGLSCRWVVPNLYELAWYFDFCRGLMLAAGLGRDSVPVQARIIIALLRKSQAYP